MQVTFFGVRGSTPCQGDEVARYGGNTSCVAVDVPGQDSILLDLGTGARYFGMRCDDARPFRGTCLLSHAHCDHIQGLPFFPPILREGGTLDVYAPEPDGDHTHPSVGDGSIGEVLSAILRPPLFPVGLDAFPGSVTFHSIGASSFAIGSVDVMARYVPHIGPTLGFRLEWGGRTVAYLSDHQQPGVDVYTTTDEVRELCDGVDLLIHDAQYTRPEFAQRSTWGHSTVEYAVWVAKECGVRSLALYHHDPTHSDDQIDRLVAAANACAPGLEVLAAREGLTIDLAAAPA